MKRIAYFSALSLMIGSTFMSCQDDHLTDAFPQNTPGTISPKAVTVTTYAGTGFEGFKNGQALEAQFYYPHGVAVASDGTLYIADMANQKVRKITPDGIVSTVRCTSDSGTISFRFLESVVVSPRGFLYLSDKNANTIYKLSAAGVISVFAGGEEGYEDGQGKLAKFHGPTGLALSSDGTLYVADESNHRIRKITPAGLVSTVAGSGNGFADGPASNAQFSFPHGTAVAADGTLFIADMGNHRIRKISISGVVSTVAGSVQGLEDGTGANAKFYHPMYLTTIPDGSLYVSDTWNHSIRLISPEGVVSTVTGGLTFPHGIVFYDDHLFVSDYTHRILRISLE